MSGPLDDSPCVPHRFDVSSPGERLVANAASMPRGSFGELRQWQTSLHAIANQLENLEVAARRGHWTQARVFELRTYTSHEGKLQDVQNRFRDHTTKLFAKHGMTNGIHRTMRTDEFLMASL